MRSSNGRPEAWYFLAIETTSRKFDCTKSRSAWSPRWTERLRASFLLGVSFATLFDGLGQANFIVLGQKGVLTNIGEVETYEVLVIPINAIFCHGSPLIPDTGDSGTTSYTGPRNLPGNTQTLSVSSHIERRGEISGQCLPLAILDRCLVLRDLAGRSDLLHADHRGVIEQRRQSRMIRECRAGVEQRNQETWPHDHGHGVEHHGARVVAGHGSMKDLIEDWNRRGL